MQACVCASGIHQACRLAGGLDRHACVHVYTGNCCNALSDEHIAWMGMHLFVPLYARLHAHEHLQHACTNAQRISIACRIALDTAASHWTLNGSFIPLSKALRGSCCCLLRLLSTHAHYLSSMLPQLQPYQCCSDSSNLLAAARHHFAATRH